MIYAAIADWADSTDPTEHYPVAFMCAELGVSRSGYYKWRATRDAAPTPRQAEDAELTAIIVDICHRQRGNPGRRRVRAELHALGRAVSHRRVHRLMQAADLQGRHPKAWKRTTLAGQRPVDAPDLIAQDFTAGEVNTRWCGDITYVKTWTGWAYLATVIDLHSRAVVGFAVADHLRADLIIEALDMAIQHRRPAPGVIFHADRGCQYTSKNFADFCARNGVRRSFGRRATCYDNAVAESFFATYKKELIHTRPWQDVQQVRTATFDWIVNYYNTTRRHSTLGYLTPREYELGFRSIYELAA